MDIKWKGNQEKIHDLENYKYGKFIVKAGPGSGKTLCVSERIIKFINQHDSPYFGLAITSFTNVAINEIKKNYERETGQKIKHPHFAGTFDSFINKYIFLPFGHLVMKCKKRPILVGEPYSKWHHRYYKCKYFDKISFNKSDALYKVYGKFNLTNNEQTCKKRLIQQKGYATQDDANYFAMKILEEFSDIAQAIVNKFPYLIIDEAQDLSEIQMEILNILIKNGLNNLWIIGDPDQAIFEWRSAKPMLFIEKFNKWQEEYGSAFELEYTFRCSENISKWLSKFSGNEIISHVESSKNVEPVLLSHEENYDYLVENFIKKVKDNLDTDINNENTAVLFRSRKELNKFINNKSKFNLTNIFKTSNKDISDFEENLGVKLKNNNLSDIKNYTENIIKGEHYFLNRNFVKGFDEFEKAFIKITENKFNNINSLIKESIVENGLYNHRKNIWEFINLFEKPTGKNQLIDEWIDINNAKLLSRGCKFYLNKIKISDKSSKIKLNRALKWENLLIDEIDVNSEYYCGTIHSVKGRSFDAVLLILKSSCTNILGQDLMRKDELRNVYVGMSRARHILDIAVPKNDLNTWENFFHDKKIQSSLDSFF